MDGLLEELKIWGCDIDGALERFMYDETVYAECLKEMAEDPAYMALGAALEAGEGKGAFFYAHTLKGVLSNLGLTPLYQTASQIVEPLREGKTENLDKPYQELLLANEKLKDILMRTLQRDS